MHVRAQSVVHAFKVCLLVTLALLTLTAFGCGRSSIDDDTYFTDGGVTNDATPDGPTGPCNASTCPNGCCDLKGVCEDGTHDGACGGGGVGCHDCVASGFDHCDPSNHSCTSTPATCDVTTCTTGCCDAFGNCLDGSSSSACGTSGFACSDCTAQGLTCDPAEQQCTVSACGPQNCAGCCSGTTCFSGTDLTLCGQGGNECLDCSQFNIVCSPTFPGGICLKPGTCDSSNCAGCCDGNLCLTGTDPNACGTGGAVCQPCSGTNQQCLPISASKGGFCSQTTCNPQTCVGGCCDANGACQGGDSTTACGSAGNFCTTCAKGDSCVNGVCQSNAGCGPGNCAGCCNSAGKCVGGGDHAACGFGGSTCTTCSSGATCTNNVCTTTGPCGASNCNGCCSGKSCFGGGDPLDCGSGGGTCKDCPSGSTCVSGVCEQNTQCGPATCPQGCCVSGKCVDGSSNGSACGSGGFVCQQCATDETCENGQCVTSPCGPQTCANCCANGVCATGVADQSCGKGGALCADCTALKEKCTGQACVAPPCGPTNCGGCCGPTGCVGGGADTACGATGTKCADCTLLGDVCTVQKCEPPTPPCNSTNCAGCCNALGTCEQGFLPTSCGSGGASCADCSAQNATCETALTPRVCSNQQTTCPAPYNAATCTATTKAPAVTHVCSTNDLAEARAACAGGANSTACQSFFQVEQSVNADCAKCLTPFDVPFQNGSGSGILTCIAPFVDASCNQDTGCLVDCETKSCSQCPAGSAAQCQNQVRRGTCSKFVNGLTCVGTALVGSAAFCNPASYAGFGGWLQGVGGHYCGP